MSWQLFDRLRAYFRRYNVYQAEQTLQDQTAIDRLVSGGQFLDLSKDNALLRQTNLQINRLERYKDYDQMDEVGEITLALDIYADESALVDPEEKHSIVVKAKSKRVKQAIEDLLHTTLMIDRQIRPMSRYLCKYGDAPFEIVLNKNRDGVAALRFINSYNFTRITTKYDDLVGFFYQDELATTPTFLHPWQVAHMRLTTYENIYHPYGRSILDGARKDFKRLRLMEDAALIYRITRAPEKRVFSIPVGNIPPKDVPQYIEMIARLFKRRRFVDPATGAVNERYSPLIQEDDFFLPKRPDGSGPSIDTLPGAENLDAIADIEYFKKKMISALKIPFSRVGIGESSDGDGKALAAVSPEFAKAIQWIQREMSITLKKVVIVHLALQGFPVEDLKSFDLRMTAASAIDELYRIETWASRADIIGALKESMMFPDDWILHKFTDMTDDEIEENEQKIRALKAAGLMGAEEGGGGMPAIGGMGGGPDLGGPGPEIEAVGEPEAGGAPELGLEAGLEGVAGMEDTNRKYSKLIQEYNEFRKGTKKRMIKEVKQENVYTNLLNNNEFDHLPIYPSEDPAKCGHKLLVESGVDKGTAQEVIKEVRELVSGNPDGDDDKKELITEEDIPS